eukprot:GAFH01001392.1.p1 GENE.GAFH01001392.1~~GAFH01001392.1.p1  ORF type:complete len:546 (+),score=162.56 GAFH01001392.1:216-1640(+)
MIASENYSSFATQFSMGNMLTDKYAEGIPHHRFYAGCENVDKVETIAASTLCKVFGCDHAFVQPHCGCDANLIAYLAVLAHKVQAPFLRDLARRQNPGVPEEQLKVPAVANISEKDWLEVRRQTGNQRLMALDYTCGGHLTHGFRPNISGLLFEVHGYGVSRETGLLDYDAIDAMAKEIRPLILLAGYSAYPRSINFARMRQIADGVGAILMVDMAHFAGLVAGGVFQGEFNPITYADIVTSTTHKTLRGPRGGLVMCKSFLADDVNRACPIGMGGPLPHVMAAKAVAFTECLRPEFHEYAQRVVANARALAASLQTHGARVLTGGTDNHMVLLDVKPFHINGRQAEEALLACGLVMNRNALPFDPEGPWFTSGIRVGTPALTTIGMGPAEMEQIGEIICEVLRHTRSAVLPAPADAPADAPPKYSRNKWVIDDGVKEAILSRVHAMLSRFVLYPELDLPLLKRYFPAAAAPAS